MDLASIGPNHPLGAAGIALVSPPVTVPFPVAAAGRKRLCYFHDPEGVLIEAAAYSPIAHDSR